MKEWIVQPDVDSTDEEHGWCIVERGTDRTVALELTNDDAWRIVSMGRLLRRFADTDMSDDVGGCTVCGAAPLYNPFVLEHASDCAWIAARSFAVTDR